MLERITPTPETRKKTCTSLYNGYFVYATPSLRMRDFAATPCL